MAARVQRNPTPRCNRRPWWSVQDQADFSESLCHLSSSSPPGGAAERYPLGRMWLVDSFCVGAVRQSARLFGASGRHSGQTPMPLDLQSAHSNFTSPFLFRSALIRGSQSRAAQHRHATDVLCLGDFTVWWHIKHCGFGHARTVVSHAADGYPFGSLRR